MNREEMRERDQYVEREIVERRCPECGTETSFQTEPSQREVTLTRYGERVERTVRMPDLWACHSCRNFWPDWEDQAGGAATRSR
jgi:uncharacterized protein with PIN domain